MRRFSSLLVVTMCVALSIRAESVRPQVEELFGRGVDLFEQGNYAAAQRTLKQVLALRPTEKEAFNLVEKAGAKVMFSMMREVKMGTGPSIIWRLYRHWKVKELRDAERIKKLVDQAVDPDNDDETRWIAVDQLIEIGQFAVPFAIAHLGNELDPDRRANAKVLLVRLGRKGVLPTIELLNHESRLVRENAAIALGEIEPSDPRAVAPLVLMTENPNETETVKKIATTAVENITGQKLSQLSSAAEYYYRKAERYYLELGGVPDETEEADGVVWHLNPAGELVYMQVPYYAWNELMAEEACHDCFHADPRFDISISLHASVMAAQYAEVVELKDLAQEQPGGRPLSEEEMQEVRERAEKLKAALFLVTSVGPEYLYEALGKALDDHRDDVAVVLIDAIKDVDPLGRLLPTVSGDEDTGRRRRADETGPRVSKAVGESLIRALSYRKEEGGQEGLPGGKNVRYHAAITLAWMNPQENFPGSNLVVKTLASAVGETGPAQILLMEEDQGKRNLIRARLEGLGYGVTLAAAGQDGWNQAAAFPPKDLIIVAADLQADWDTKRVLEELKAEARTHYIPVLILTDMELRDDARRTFPDYRAIYREDEPGELKRVTEEVLAHRTTVVVNKRRSEEIAVMAAEALNKIDPYHTNLTTADASTALTEALEGRADVVRLPCIQALGLFKIQAALDTLAKVFQDRSNAIEIRRAALWAMGQIGPQQNSSLFLDAELNEGDFELRRRAAEGYGLGKPDYGTAIRFLDAVRIDKEKKER